ncbi:MAG: monothiol glutaredoxin grx4 [Trichoglossum hirsutum]|nr:MAG: monothiol glutaredoxin grx4 [Trichoglossum hirsutum]
MSRVQEITTDASFHRYLSTSPPNTLLVLNFHTPWAEPCKQMSSVLSALAASYPPASPPLVSFLSIDAEELPDVSEKYDVSAVPLLVLLRDGKVLQTVSGSGAAMVRDAVERHAGKGAAATTAKSTLPPLQKVEAPAVTDTNGAAETANSNGQPPSQTTGAPAADGATEENTLRSRLTALVSAASVMLFMKGTPSAPQCGFSRQIVALLRGRGVRYGFFNILADDEVRQGLKTFADWPTFPQLWVAGELVGGLDIVKEEFENDPGFLKEYAVKQNGGTTAPPTTADGSTT